MENVLHGWQTTVSNVVINNFTRILKESSKETIKKCVGNILSAMEDIIHEDDFNDSNIGSVDKLFMKATNSVFFNNHFMITKPIIAPEGFYDIVDKDLKWSDIFTDYTFIHDNIAEDLNIKDNLFIKRYNEDTKGVKYSRLFDYGMIQTLCSKANSSGFENIKLATEAHFKLNVILLIFTYMQKEDEDDNSIVRNIAKDINNYSYSLYEGNEVKIVACENERGYTREYIIDKNNKVSDNSPTYTFRFFVKFKQEGGILFFDDTKLDSDEHHDVVITQKILNDMRYYHGEYITDDGISLFAFKMLNERLYGVDIKYPSLYDKYMKFCVNGVIQENEVIKVSPPTASNYDASEYGDPIKLSVECDFYTDDYVVSYGITGYDDGYIGTKIEKEEFDYLVKFNEKYRDNY